MPPCFIHFKAMDMLGSASSLVHAGLGAGPAASPLCTAAAAAADLSAVTGSLDTPNATGSHTNRSGHKKNQQFLFFCKLFKSPVPDRCLSLYLGSSGHSESPEKPFRFVNLNYFKKGHILMRSQLSNL